MIYTPKKGFYNLSKKPDTLSQRDFEKIQIIQMDVMFVHENLEYYKKYNPFQLDKMREVHANLQLIILQHWKWEKKECEPKQLILELAI